MTITCDIFKMKYRKIFLRKVFEYYNIRNKVEELQVKQLILNEEYIGCNSWN